MTFKLTLTEYKGNGEFETNEFTSETDAQDVIDSWAIWNDNEKFDFRLPTPGVRDLLVIHLHKNNDTFYLGTTNAGRRDDPVPIAFRFLLTVVGSTTR